MKNRSIGYLIRKRKPGAILVESEQGVLKKPRLGRSKGGGGSHRRRGEVMGQSTEAVGGKAVIGITGGGGELVKNVNQVLSTRQISDTYGSGAREVGRRSFCAFVANPMVLGMRLHD